MLWEFVLTQACVILSLSVCMCMHTRAWEGNEQQSLRYKLSPPSSMMTVCAVFSGIKMERRPKPAVKDQADAKDAKPAPSLDLRKKTDDQK